MKTFAPLYKLDNKGNMRVWYMESDGDKIRAVSGLEYGEHVTSAWKTMEAKNVGRLNATTPEEQAEVEIEAMYTKQLNQGKYFRDRDDVNKETYIKPMLAESIDDYPVTDWSDVYSQPKFDGLRGVLKEDGIFSRNGKPFVSVPHITLAAFNFFRMNPGVVLDGELYAHEYRDNFNEIMSAARKTKPKKEDLEKASVVKYHVYDVVIPGVPFSERIKIAEQYIEMIGSPHFVLTPTHKVNSQEELDALYESYIEDGYEGQMVRHDEEYQNKRSKFLLKRKTFQTQEFEIVDILSGIGNAEGYAKRIVYKLDNEDGKNPETGEYPFSGVRGNQAFTKKLLEEKDKYIGGDVTIRFFNRTPAGVLRFPVAIDFFEGKREH